MLLYREISRSRLVKTRTIHLENGYYRYYATRLQKHSSSIDGYHMATTTTAGGGERQREASARPVGSVLLYIENLRSRLVKSRTFHLENGYYGYYATRSEQHSGSVDGN